MRTTSKWAFKRRMQYGTGFGLFWILVFTGVYFVYFNEAPTCFDLAQNGDERGIDCGGSCTRICAMDVQEPKVRWAQSFRVRDEQYNAVAYIENRNRDIATPEMNYTFTLYDSDGLITETTGTTILPPDSVYPIFVGPIQTGDRIPTQTFIELSPPEVWLPAETGRDQFSVVDRDLIGVDESPRLNASIRNNALTEAREVEVVATIFDAKGNALTSSRTFVQNFAPQTEQNVVFTWPEPIAKTLRSCEVPTDVLIAIDLSGSMNNDSLNPPQPITSVVSSAQAFISRLKEKDQVSVVTFASEAMTVLTFSNDTAGAVRTVGDLDIDPEEETGNTNTGDAFALALQEFSSDRHSQNARKVMVILTDGLATAPEDDPEEYAKAQALAVKNSGVEVYAIGLGEQVNMDFVHALATRSDLAFQALSSAQVDQIYQTITGTICEDGAAVIDIIPKTNASFQEVR
jgi:Mg-chelatase subunit ChlD